MSLEFVWCDFLPLEDDDIRPLCPTSCCVGYVEVSLSSLCQFVDFTAVSRRSILTLRNVNTFEAWL